MLRLTVLGASAVRPNPGGACAGYLVRAGGRLLLVDCGFGVLSALTERDVLKDLDGVLVSHAHPDHCADLLGIHMALSYAPSEKRHGPLAVWAGPDVIDVLPSLGDPYGQDMRDGPLTFETLPGAVEADLGGPCVRIARTRHSVPGWALRISFGGASLVYTGDTGPSDEVEGLARGAGLLLAESTMLARAGRAGEEGHMTATEAGRLASEAGAARLVLTHYDAALGRDRLQAAAEAGFGGPVRVAREGDTYDIETT